MKLQLNLGTTGREVYLTPREISLMMGRSTGQNVLASLRHAYQLLSSVNTGNVLYINTVQTPWKFAESKRNALPDPDNIMGDYYFDGTMPRIFFLTSDVGELHKEKNAILNYIRENGIKTVIINSWEFASRNSRVRETLLFLLRGFNSGDKHPKFDRVRFDNSDPNGAFVYDYFPATILIYAEDTGVEIEAEKIQRRGFGKLAAIADQVVYLPQDELRAEVEMPVIEEDEYGRTEFQSVLEETEEQEVDTNEELVLSANDPRIGTEDEPGIDDEEYTRRFLARVKPIAQKEWEERMRNEKLKAETEPAVAESQPVTSIEELRSTPDELARMPIHMNSYSPDKTPAPGSKPIRPSANMPKRQTQNVHSDVIEK